MVLKTVSDFATEGLLPSFHFIYLMYLMNSGGLGVMGHALGEAI